MTDQKNAVVSPRFHVVAKSLMFGCLLLAGVFVGRAFCQWNRTNDLTLARKLAEDGSVDAAVEAYRRHLSNSPTDHSVRLELATLLQRRNPEGALVEFREIPPGTPEHLSAARYVASISILLERDQDAIAPLELLSARFPDDTGAQLALAEIFFRQRDYEKSLELSRRLFGLKPDSIEACLLMAESSDSLGHVVDMIEPLEAALRLSDDLPQAHMNLAYAYESAGEAEKAAPHVLWYLKRYPTSASAHRLLAMVERSRGRFDEALTAAQEGLKLAPESPELAILTAELLLYLHHASEAYEMLSNFAQNRPREQRLLAVLLRAAVLSGKTEEAKDLQMKLQKIQAKN